MENEKKELPINVIDGQVMIGKKIKEAIRLIDKINIEDDMIIRTVGQMNHLGLSAKIETAHLGTKATSFRVISDEILPLNLEIKELVTDSKKLSAIIKNTILNIAKAIENKSENSINFNEYSALETKLKEIEELIKLIKKDDDNIISISKQINLLSLNATISSNHMIGPERKVFEEIANKISKVDKKINEFAQKSSQDSEELIMMLDDMIELVKKIYENQEEKEESKTKVFKIEQKNIS